MKRIMLTLFCLFLTSPAFALTATWKNNTESDMKEYAVYMCKVKGCTVVREAAQQVAIVPFNAAVVPTWVLPNVIEGTLAVTARDTSGNESELSNQVPFDSQAPKAPTGALVTK
jgi:hypothetical protein